MFIELTVEESGEKVLTNIDAIRVIITNEDGKNLVSIKEDDYFYSEETYDEIKKKLAMIGKAL